MSVTVLLSGNDDDDEDDDDGSTFYVFASSLTLIKVGGNYTTPAGWSAHVGAIYYIRPETYAFNNVADEEVVGPRERTPSGVFCRHHGGEV